MGFKKVLFPFVAFDAQAVTGTNVYTSPAVNIQNLDNLNIQVFWTNTCAGNIDILISQDNETFNALSAPTWPALAGSAGKFKIMLNQLSDLWLKVQYTNTSGSGALTVSIAGKDLN
jgi:hypothetical protein